MSDPRRFYSRRVGLRWQPVYVAGDGIERPLFPSLLFWRWMTAETVCMVARHHWNDGLWAAGGHPLQQEADDRQCKIGPRSGGASRG